MYFLIKVQWNFYIVLHTIFIFNVILCKSSIILLIMLYKTYTNQHILFKDKCIIVSDYIIIYNHFTNYD